jgi:hypothetical protein
MVQAMGNTVNSTLHGLELLESDDSDDDDEDGQGTEEHEWEGGLMSAMRYVCVCVCVCLYVCMYQEST